MENNIQKFKSSEFGEIRTISIAGEPWFVAKDVCDILELTDVSMTMRHLDDDEKRIQVLFVSGSQNNTRMWFVNESGLYNMIFQSRKPKARLFRRWVTHEVLPQIRKTGSYGDNSRCMGAVVDKMLDIQKQQMDIIRSLVNADSSMNCNVYDDTQGVFNSTQLSEEDMFTEYSGNIIRNLRSKLGISQKELAHRANIERTHLIHIEKGQNKPSTPIFFELLKVMGYMVILLESKQLKGERKWMMQRKD